MLLHVINILERDRFSYEMCQDFDGISVKEACLFLYSVMKNH